MTKLALRKMDVKKAMGLNLSVPNKLSNPTKFNKTIKKHYNKLILN